LLWRSVIIFQSHRLEIRGRSCFVCYMFHIEADVTWRFATVFAHSWIEFQKISLESI
jgi:hypothetical protein